MNRLTSEELREMREYTEAATAGPWYAEPSDKMRGDRRPAVVMHPQEDDCYIHADVASMTDATFIAKARADMPRLLDEVETLMTEARDGFWGRFAARLRRERDEVRTENERLTSAIKRERDANDGLLDIIRDLVDLHEDDVVERPAVALAKSVLIGK